MQHKKKGFISVGNWYGTTKYWREKSSTFSNLALALIENNIRQSNSSLFYIAFQDMQFISSGNFL